MMSGVEIIPWWRTLADLVMHSDQLLLHLATHQGHWLYVVVFLILFCETGVLVAAFLPGDSLLFFVGALAAQGELNLSLMLLLMFTAAVLGGVLNYHVGHWSSQRWLRSRASRWISQDAVQAAQHFYVRHGGKSLVLARFAPVLRTFAPFVAGLSHMPYLLFTYYNVLGALLWISTLTYAGYFFGNLSVVKNNLHYLLLSVIGLLLGFIGISLLLPLVKWWRQRAANIRGHKP
jgi:membrane-associated protein